MGGQLRHGSDTRRALRTNEGPHLSRMRVMYFTVYGGGPVAQVVWIRNLGTTCCSQFVTTYRVVVLTAPSNDARACNSRVCTTA